MHSGALPVLTNCRDYAQCILVITTGVETGQIYQGKVVLRLDFCTIVGILPGKNKVEDFLKEGQKVRVKVLEPDEKGSSLLPFSLV
jgi:polyribonucleotide nucleotidyltransferase